MIQYPAHPRRIGVFAYGSNLCTRQMKKRCPSAVKGPLARLSGHRLTFTGYSGSWGGAVATIEQESKSEVHGVIWWVTERDLALLDRFEGTPTVYGRYTMTVTTEDEHELKVQVYFKGEDFYNVPSMEYLLTIWQGYNEHNLPTRHLRSAAARVTREMESSDVE